MRLIDFTGRTFGQLTVIKRAANKNGRVHWHCQCTCGKFCDVAANNLDRGNSQSCGCRVVDLAKKHFTTHGKTRTAEYNIWNKMKERCYIVNSPRFHDYGGRGIKILWNSFEEFYKDMGPRPSPKHSIERKDNDGHYGKENCKWATYTEQANNKRTNINLTFQGRTQSARKWAQEFNINYLTLYQRIKNHWPIEIALTTPAHIGRNQYSR